MIKVGVVHGNRLMVGFKLIGRIVVANPQVTKPAINCVKTCGIKNNGFKIIGIPNMIGSVMLKIDGINDNFPNCFIFADLLRIIKKVTKPMKPAAYMPI